MNYKYFIKYDQWVFGLMFHGFTDMYYAIREDFKILFIRKLDVPSNTQSDLQFPIISHISNDKIVLTEFLIEFMACPSNFMGSPEYISSPIFSKVEFEVMLDKGISLLDSRKKIAIEKGNDNELIKYCYALSLYPEPKGSGEINWIANCPSGSSHHIQISIQSNEWGCGYCKREGNLSDLKLWLKNKNNKS